MTCLESDSNHQSPLLPQCQTEAEWAGILTDEIFGQDRQVRKTLAFSNEVEAYRSWVASPNQTTVMT
jgi:hypothetical protein